MKAVSLFLGSLALAATSTALAGLPVALGSPLGITLGINLGTVLGFQLGTPLPIVAGGLLAVAAASLGLGIWIVRRKKDR